MVQNWVTEAGHTMRGTLCEVEGTVTGRGEDGRWHMSLTGKANGFHLRYLKEQNIEVVDGPTASTCCGC